MCFLRRCHRARVANWRDRTHLAPPSSAVVAPSAARFVRALRRSHAAARMEPGVPPGDVLAAPPQGEVVAIVHVAGDTGFVWDAVGACSADARAGRGRARLTANPAAARRLRQSCRLVGAMVGALAGFRQQDAVHGLPLQLSADEVTLAADRGASRRGRVSHSLQLSAAPRARRTHRLGGARKAGAARAAGRPGGQQPHHCAPVGLQLRCAQGQAPPPGAGFVEQHGAAQEHGERAGKRCADTRPHVLQRRDGGAAVEGAPPSLACTLAMMMRPAAPRD